MESTAEERLVAVGRRAPDRADLPTNNGIEAWIFVGTVRREGPISHDEPEPVALCRQAEAAFLWLRPYKPSRKYLQPKSRLNLPGSHKLDHLISTAVRCQACFWAFRDGWHSYPQVTARTKYRADHRPANLFSEIRPMFPVNGWRVSTISPVPRPAAGPPGNLIPLGHGVVVGCLADLEPGSVSLKRAEAFSSFWFCLFYQSILSLGQAIK